MYRTILCLPFCLLMPPEDSSETPPVQPVRTPAPVVVALANNAAAEALPSNADMERLAKTDPIAFVEACLRKYQRDVKGYSMTMQKQEFLNGRLQPRESVAVCFRENPYSLYLNWQEGAKMAERALYVDGENNGMVLARPRGVAARLVAGNVVARDPEGADAKAAGRYSLKEFGLKKSTERILAAWKGGKANGALKIEFLGIQKIKDCGDRPCFSLRRILDKPENEGCTEALYHFDAETWLLSGSILKGPDGALMGVYYFRDVRLNPDFKPIQFQRAALIP